MTQQPISPLRRRMIEDMTVRNLSPSTQQSYIYAVANFSRHFGRSPIEACRTAALGGHVERCADCAHERISYNSCRNRHCTKCQ